MLSLLEKLLGLVFLTIGMIKVSTWGQFNYSLVELRPSIRSEVAALVVAAELMLGCLLLTLRSDRLRGTFLVVFSATLLGARVTLPMTPTCACLGIVTESCVVISVVLASCSVGSIRFVSAGGSRASLTALYGVALVGGALVAMAASGSSGWTSAWTVPEIGAAEDLVVQAPTGIHEKWQIEAAETTCDCFSVLGVE